MLISPDTLVGVTRLAPSDNASEGCVEQATRNRGHTGFDPFGVVDSACGHIRQTAPAWADVGSAELYSGVESHQLGFGIAEARQPYTLGNVANLGRPQVIHRSQT